MALSVDHETVAREVDGVLGGRPRLGLDDDPSRAARTGEPRLQWVLTAPSEVRRLLALKPEALTAQNRIFVEEIAA